MEQESLVVAAPRALEWHISTPSGSYAVTVRDLGAFVYRGD